jgi:hypothetical protein
MMGLALCLAACPALAGDSVAPGPAEPQGRPVVRIEAVLGLVDLGAGDMGQVLAAFDLDAPREKPARGWCGIDLACGDGYQRPAAPVPLPVAGGLLAAALAGLAVVKGMRA